MTSKSLPLASNRLKGDGDIASVSTAEPVVLPVFVIVAEARSSSQMLLPHTFNFIDLD
jgi:hypothetical protein